MNSIDYAEISNFKGLQEIHLEFGGFNIITGKNNMGKSSLLEAIQLAYQPPSMGEYGGNIHKLINVSADRAEIKLASEDTDRDLSLQHPEKEQVPKLVLEIINKLFDPEAQDEFGLYILIDNINASKEDINSITDPIKSAIEQTTRSLPKDLVSTIRENMMEVSFNANEYIYVNFEGWMNSFLHFAIPHVVETLEEEIPEKYGEIFDETNTDSEKFIYRLVRHFIDPHTDRGFLYDSPPSDGITFIQEPMLEGEPPEESDGDEDQAVKKVNVRDYLRQRGISEDIEDFDFDELVFGGSEERYSIPYEFMGDGFKTIVGIVWEFVGDGEVSDILLLEEPENHMHPGYVNELVPFLISVAKEEDIQLFVTTHNIDFIMEFFSDELAKENYEYLKNQLTLTQMSELIPKQFGYSEAESQVEEVHNDLRGI